MVVVTFSYELEYEQGYDESEIISGLESSFVDFLLPILFDSQCTYKRKRELTSSRRLETVGLSKRPDDMVLQDGKAREPFMHDAYFCVLTHSQLLFP